MTLLALVAAATLVLVATLRPAPTLPLPTPPR